MNEANRLARCLGITSCPCTPIFELAEQLVGHLGAAVVRAYLEGDERGISAGRAADPRRGRRRAAMARPGEPRRLRGRLRPLILASRGTAGYFFAVGHWSICTRAISAYLPPPAGLKIVASPSLTSNQSLPKVSRMFGLCVTTRVLVPGSGAVPTRVRRA